MTLVGRARRHRGIATIACVTMLSALSAGCSSAAIGADSYDSGRSTVVELANATLAILPADSTFFPHPNLTLDDADRELCHKKIAGFAYSKLSARRPQVTALVELPETSNAGLVLAKIEASWRNMKYSVDTKGMRDPDFPNVHAIVGEYELVATSFSNTAGFANKPRISIYATGRCLNA